jgi:hypothetical protein
MSENAVRKAAVRRRLKGDQILKKLKEAKKNYLHGICNNRIDPMLENIEDIPLLSKRLVVLADGNCIDVLFFKDQANKTPRNLWRTVGQNPWNRTPLKDKTKEEIIKKLKKLRIDKLTNGISIDNMFKQESAMREKEQSERRADAAARPPLGARPGWRGRRRRSAAREQEASDRRRARRERTAAWNEEHPAETWQEQQEREEDEEQAAQEGWYD